MGDVALGRGGRGGVAPVVGISSGAEARDAPSPLGDGRLVGWSLGLSDEQRLSRMRGAPQRSWAAYLM